MDFHFVNDLIWQGFQGRLNIENKVMETKESIVKNDGLCRERLVQLAFKSQGKRLSVQCCGGE